MRSCFRTPQETVFEQSDLVPLSYLIDRPLPSVVESLVDYVTSYCNLCRQPNKLLLQGSSSVGTIIQADMCAKNIAGWLGRLIRYTVFIHSDVRRGYK